MSRTGESISVPFSLLQHTCTMSLNDAISQARPVGPMAPAACKHSLHSALYELLLKFNGFASGHAFNYSAGWVVRFCFSFTKDFLHVTYIARNGRMYRSFRLEAQTHTCMQTRCVARACFKSYTVFGEALVKQTVHCRFLAVYNAKR